MANCPNAVWITWERHRRTTEISDFLGVRLLVFESTLPRYIRHPVNALRTVMAIHRERPRVLIVQNPSMVLAAIACVLRPLYGYRLIVDSHNAGIAPESGLQLWMGFIYRYIQQGADLTIVTNPHLAAKVSGNGGRPFVLPDRIPRPSSGRKISLKGRFNVAFICTFKDDEPFTEVIEASRGFGEGVFFYITGNPKRCPARIREGAGSNVIFTGFLAENDYWDLLSSVQLVIDLTKREDCLVCGAYEATAAASPMILSDTPVLREHFYKGVVYAENTCDGISKAVRQGLRDHEALKRDVKLLRDELTLAWHEAGGRLMRYIKDQEPAPEAETDKEDAVP